MAHPRRTREQWQAIIDHYLGSGLSGIDYCRREGIQPKSFYRAKSMYSSPSSTTPFIQATPQSVSTAEITLILPNCTIQSSSQVSPQWLAQLVVALSP